MLKNNYDVIIIGGGVIGASCAFYLQKVGKKTLLLEQKTIGYGASFAAAGMLGAQSEDIKNKELFNLAKKSRSMFKDLSSEIKKLTSIDIELNNNGILKIATTQAEKTSLQSIVKQQKEIGEVTVWLNKEEVQQYEPNFKGELLGAIEIPYDGNVNAINLTLGLSKAACNIGAEIKENTKVTEIIYEGDRAVGVKTSFGVYNAKYIVVTSGSWSSNLLHNLKMYPVKGEAISVSCVFPVIKRTIFTKDCYIVPKLNNTLIIGATEVVGDYSTNVSVGSIHKLIQSAINIVPLIRDCTFKKAWAGTRPQTTSSIPYFYNDKQYKNVIVCTGHYRNGILLSPISGKLVAEFIKNGKGYFNNGTFN